MNTRRNRAARSFTVLVASDWAPIRAFDRPMRRDPESVYGDLLPALRAADLRIVNCECALTRARRAVWKSGSVFKGDPAHVKALTVVPFDVACLGNNHVLDYDVAGLRDTLNVLHDNGVRTVGAGLTDGQAHRPVRMTVRGTNIHIVNFSEGEDLTAAVRGPGVFGWDLARASAEVARRRRQGGVVIAIAHCGLEYIPFPPPYVVAAFHAVVDAGADCVIGHHPHVPQGIEWYRGRPIVYSLGNFAFYQATNLFWRRTGFCVNLRFDGTELTGIDLLPYRIGDTGLRALDSKEAASFRRSIARISASLAHGRKVERAWQSYLAYYGVTGFVNEVRGILEKMRVEPRKGAAMFRNRITTMQHRELWRDFLTRVMTGEAAPSSRESLRIIQEWFTRMSADTRPVNVPGQQATRRTAPSHRRGRNR